MYRKFGDYEIIIRKEVKKEPARLEKKEVEDDGTAVFRKLNSKINMVILILLFVLFVLVCYMVTPQTYGFL